MTKKKEVALQVPFKLEDVVSLEYEGETWYHISSVIGYLREITDPDLQSKYWYKCKKELKTRENIETSPIWRQLSLTAADGKTREGIECSPIWRTLKLTAADGKMYKTDFATQEAIFRIVQSIPSPAPKIQALKNWLAKTGAAALSTNVVYLADAKQRHDTKIGTNELKNTLKSAELIMPEDFATIFCAIMQQLVHKMPYTITLELIEKGIVKSKAKKIRDFLHPDLLKCIGMFEALVNKLIIERDIKGRDNILTVCKEVALLINPLKTILGVGGNNYFATKKESNGNNLLPVQELN